MKTIEELNREFGIEGVAKFESGQGGLPRLSVTAPAAHGHVYLHGAHVTHFQPAGQPPMLFLSSRSFFEPGKAIRGGVPLIFPWFGPRHGADKNAMHGIVRTMAWDVKEVGRAGDGDGVRAAFAIASSIETRSIWNYDYELRFIVTMDKALTMELQVTNRSGNEFEFEDCMHTYFAVDDVRQIWIDGLNGTQFVDKSNDGPQVQTDGEKPKRFAKATDRVYFSTQPRHVINDPTSKRRIVLEKTNARSSVVWNPWKDKIGTFIDLTELDWSKFVCVENGNVRQNALKLAAGATHVMKATVFAEAM